MKKILLLMPLGLMLFACNNDDDYVTENIEIVDPNSESDGIDVNGSGSGREKELTHCGNRWDCTKVAPKIGGDTIKTIQANQILNVK